MIINLKKQDQPFAIRGADLRALCKVSDLKAKTFTFNLVLGD
jgi:hypothetical protein